MHYSKLAITAAGLALFGVSRADDLELDSDDIPRECRDLCEPVRRLADICEVDDDISRMSDRDEDLLQAQCFCTNTSFDVAGRTAQCAACMHENNRDRDDNDDIDDIMWTCGFSSSSTWDQSAHTTGVAVDATRPVSTEELTTTIQGGSPAQTNNDNSPTPTNDNNNSGGSNNNNDDNSNDSNSNNNDSNDSNSNSNNNGDDDSAAAGLAPALGFGAYIMAAAVAGGMMLR